MGDGVLVIVGASVGVGTAVADSTGAGVTEIRSEGLELGIGPGTSTSEFVGVGVTDGSGEEVGISEDVGVGIGAEVALVAGVGVGVIVGAGTDGGRTFTVFRAQTNFFPTLVQINFLPLTTLLAPTFEQTLPTLGAVAATEVFAAKITIVTTRGAMNLALRFRPTN